MKRTRWSNAQQLKVDHPEAGAYAEDFLFQTVSFRQERDGTIIAEGAVYEMWWDGKQFLYFLDRPPRVRPPCRWA